VKENTTMIHEVTDASDVRSPGKLQKDRIMASPSSLHTPLKKTACSLSKTMDIHTISSDQYETYTVVVCRTRKTAQGLDIR
jgi:hypothetical protein